jgi:isoamylase
VPQKVDFGVPLPLGAHQRGTGINFAVFSRHATCVSLLLYDEPRDNVPTSTFTLRQQSNRTGDIWHLWIEDVGPGSLYAWRMDGPNAPEQGDRFNKHRILLDPYATALVGTDCWDFACSCSQKHCDIGDDDAAFKPKCLVSDQRFDWQGDRQPAHLWSETVIYETHVRGITIHPSSAVKHPGTFLGIVEKIPYFTDLGITAIELLPVQEFFENELDRYNPLNGEHLRNYWGYNTVAFFAPKESYSTRSEPGCQVREFKTMVRALHRADIEVILDIVFNHTAEGNHTGPTLNFRGLDNRIYYLLEKDRRFYKNYAGTGNTLNCNHPVVRDYILDCLRHWVMEMHVDGFRFDLASVMERDEEGNLLPNPPILERIAEDPILRNVKLIAEAWDAAGVYQVGRFPGQRWSEWNGRYRDDVRRFWRGDPDMAAAMASRLCGSADLYQQTGKEPLNSINYLTCHDGFTLNDLVSYAQKHNEANGEENQDGIGENYSANYGTEGPSADPGVEILRKRQIKNMLATLMLSRGVPMLLGGDEFRRSQLGNNNAYCQDNEVSWYDWKLLEQQREIYIFTRDMIRLRKRFAFLSVEEFYTAEEVSWFNFSGAIPDWSSSECVLGCHIHPVGYNDELCLLFNAESEEVLFSLPPPRHRSTHWCRQIDTAEINLKKEVISQRSYKLAPHSMVILSVSY